LQPRAEQGSLRLAPRGEVPPPTVFHLKTLYADDEAKPGYAYSGSSLRSESLSRQILGSLEGRTEDVVEVRMRRPVGHRPSGGTGALLEPRFTLMSLVQRVFLGSAGSLGSKKALFLMDYLGNRFDSGPLLHRLEIAPPPRVLLFDGLSSFAFLGDRVTESGGVEAVKIYLSHDYEPDFVMDRYLSAIARRRIGFALDNSNLVVVATRRDKLRYLSHRRLEEDKVLVFPNIFMPPKESLRLYEKADTFTVAVVQSGWSGRVGAQSDAEELVAAIRLLPLGTRLRILAFGEDLPGFLRARLDGRLDIEALGRVPSRGEFLNLLSKAHVGINQGRWLGGSNVKRYDYAIAGTVPVSNALGARGELLPHECVFADAPDLAAKLLELSELGSEELARLGRENLDAVSSAANAASAHLDEAVGKLGRAR
jgi:hypothetical protein